MNKQILALLCLFFVCGVASAEENMPAFDVKPSFDCTKARSRTEIMICRDKKLSFLDAELGAIYLQAKLSATDQAAFKAENAREWKKRETTCKEKTCLLSWYAQRKSQLNAWLNAVQSETQPTADNNQTQQEHEELARYKAKDELDESNKQLNIVWNATTKTVREALLPEQRQWLKQRENDCTVKASAEEASNMILQETIKLHCMAAMTDPRTEELKQKIASMTTEGDHAKSITSGVFVNDKILQKGLYRDTSCEDEKNKITSAECLCKADIHYLVIDGLTNKLAQEKINKASKALAKQSMCIGVPTNIAESESQSYFNLRYKITLQSDAILAIAKNSEEYYNDSVHGIESIEGIIIDIKTGKILAAPDIFGGNILQVNQIIYSNLMKREDGSSEDIEKLKGKFLDAGNSTLLVTPEGVKVVFRLYMVTPYASGIPEVLIPKEYISNADIAAALHRKTAKHGLEAQQPEPTAIVETEATGENKPTTNNNQAKKKTEEDDPKCSGDLQCWGHKYVFTADAYCRESIEKLSEYSTRWTDRFLEPKFSRFRWLDKAKGTVTYTGDKIEFQNSFGAYQNYIYECDFDPISEKVFDARAYPGRLP